MANNGNQKIRAYILDDLAQIVAALEALDVLESRTRHWCFRPYVSRDDIDSLSLELRRIRAGLAAGQGKRLEELEELERR